MHTSAKDTYRILDDSSNPLNLDKVFSEYDWRRQEFVPTLRKPSSASSTSSSSPGLPKTGVNRHRFPTSRQNEIDDVLASNCLLSHHNSIFSTVFQTNAPASYPSSSPLSHLDSFQSPLQQHIVTCNGAGRKADFLYDFPRPTLVRQVPRQQPTPARRRRKNHYPASVASSSSTSSYSSDRVERAGSPTWSLDSTTVETGCVSLSSVLSSSEVLSGEENLNVSTRFAFRPPQAEFGQNSDEDSCFYPQPNLRRRAANRLPRDLLLTDTLSHDSFVQLPCHGTAIMGESDSKIMTESDDNFEEERCEMGRIEAVVLSIRSRYAMVAMKWRLGTLRLRRRL